MKKIMLFVVVFAMTTWLSANLKDHVASESQMINSPIEQEEKDKVNQTGPILSSMKVENIVDIAPDSLLKAIIAPHKGKVVLIDIWNTWCPPCRNAIKLNEPYKTGELANKDLIWIYIANETSPINTYNEMIPHIKGIHYRVNDAQWKHITKNMFNIDGIPSYILVEKNGKYALRNDFRNHALMVETLKEELGKDK